MSRHEDDLAGYSKAVGDDYDELYPDDELETDAAAEALVALAARRPKTFLEFGVGTGRLSLAMLRRGFTVAGIEISERMVAQLRAKQGGQEIDVVTGDFTAARVAGEFSLVAVVFNTIFGLPSREAQAACLENAAHHLIPGGCFVVEAYVLHPSQLDGDWTVWPRTVAAEHVELQLSRYDAADQRLERMLVHLRSGAPRFVTVTDCYAWPGELDLMAKAAGFVLRERWAAWDRTPFSGASRKHVSVYSYDGT